MDRLSFSVGDLLERGAMEQLPELKPLFHRLNNQLGIILAHAETHGKEGGRRNDPRTRNASREQRA